MAAGVNRARQTVAVLEADPDLATGLEPGDAEAARRQAVAAVFEVQPPDWDPRRFGEGLDGGWLGLLVIDGLMIRRVTVGRRSACELFGPGDLIRPWDADGDYDPLPITIDWLVRKPTRLAVLDAAFALRIAPWPRIASALVGRVAHRARQLALTHAVSHLPRVYGRLLILFWLLAERWGRVGPNGVRVILPLTHEVLAMLVGARRPTVTIALQRLIAAGLLVREDHECWLLTGLAIERLAAPESLALIDEVQAGEQTADRP
ncbi:MAG: helix-turn-helix domain-containing protein [Actinomycetota bacterium]|nr:helix-turn-helix domain-containing protein [Actinomycetota bacterium]